MRKDERACPFCRASARETAAPLAAVLSLATVLVGCTDGPSTQTASGEAGDAGDAADRGESDGSGMGDASASLSGTGSVLTAESGGFESGEVDSDDTATTAMTSVGFIYGSPDGGAVTVECDLYVQDCPRGEKCMPWGNDGGTWNATRCSPIADTPGQVGDPCTVEGGPTSGIDDCDIAMMCWDVDEETNMGTCVAMCQGSADTPLCDDPDTTCAIANDGVINLCLQSCDPILQDCPKGDGCYPVGQDFVCAPDASDEGGAYGDGCEFINACDPGLVCLAPETVPGCVGAIGCCTEVCDLTDAAGDAQCSGVMEGQQCEPWYEEGEGPPQLETVGVCVVPP